MSSVVGLGVALGMCIAVMVVMAFFLASHLRRPVCQNCKGKYSIHPLEGRSLYSGNISGCVCLFNRERSKAIAL